jgi:hypothetical protein
MSFRGEPFALVRERMHYRLRTSCRKFRNPASRRPVEAVRG